MTASLYEARGSGVERTMRLCDDILVVDPDPTARGLPHDLLSRLAGCRVRQAANLAEALAVFTAAPCSLVFAAVELADASGLDVLKSVRRCAPEVAVVLVGRRSWQAVLAALRGGADDYLPEPVTEAELAAALERARAAEHGRTASRVREEALQARVADLQATQVSLTQAASMAALGRLAANLAHEINNPLTPIFGMATLLLDDLPPDHIDRNYAEVIAALARRIRDVVRSLRDFAHPDAQEHAPIDLVDLVRDILLLTQQRLRDYNVDVDVKLPERPCIVEGSPAQLKQALLLLIENAREAMPAGGALSLNIHEEQTDEAGRRVVIAIRDTGTGISPQHLPYLFEPFFSTKSQMSGVGLGLAVAHSIVQSHNGIIEVESAVGQGSTFRVVLPTMSAKTR